MAIKKLISLKRLRKIFKAREGLVPVKVMASRGGRTYMTTVLKRVGRQEIDTAQNRGIITQIKKRIKAVNKNARLKAGESQTSMFKAMKTEFNREYIRLLLKAGIDMKQQVVIKRVIRHGVFENTPIILLKAGKKSGRLVKKVIINKKGEKQTVLVDPNKKKPGARPSTGKPGGSENKKTGADKRTDRERKKEIIKDALKGFLNTLTDVLSGKGGVDTAARETEQTGAEIDAQRKADKERKKREKEKNKTQSPVKSGGKGI